MNFHEMSHWRFCNGLASILGLVMRLSRSSNVTLSVFGLEVLVWPRSPDKIYCMIIDEYRPSSVTAEIICVGHHPVTIVILVVLDYVEIVVSKDYRYWIIATILYCSFLRTIYVDTLHVKSSVLFMFFSKSYRPYHQSSAQVADGLWFLME